MNYDEFIKMVKSYDRLPHFEIHDRCPDCWDEAPDDDREPIDGLMEFTHYYNEPGGFGWKAVKCDHCGCFYAMDISL